MPCNIIYSSNDVISGVEDKNGNTSQLFQQIYLNPHVKTAEDAINIYTNVFEQNEQPLRFENEAGNSFPSYAAAIRNTNSGKIAAKSGDVTLFTVDSTTDISNFNGLVNNLIKSNLLTGETVIDTDGKKLYKVAGNSEYKRAITSDSAITIARSSVGYSAKRNSAGDLYFDFATVNQRTILNKQDELVSVPNAINDKSYTQLKRESSDAVGLLAEQTYKENNRAFGDTSPLEELEIIPEDQLQENLLNLLKNLGVTAVSLENYSKRQGTPVDAQALADIANKIVAFKDGNTTTAELSEETAHFIIEATNPAELEDLLRNIHRTAEWAQFEPTYREIYKDENLLRKEILGKVLANAFQDNFAQNKASQTENSIIGRLRDLFNSFIARVQAYFKPAYQVQLDTYTKAVYANLMSGSLFSQLDASQLDGKKYNLYSITQAGYSSDYNQKNKLKSTEREKIRQESFNCQ